MKISPNEYMDISAKACTYANQPPEPHETAAYAQFVRAATELVDEEHVPECVQGMDREKAIKHINHVLMQNIKSHRLRRMFALMNPETALEFADLVARNGADKVFWRSKA